MGSYIYVKSLLEIILNYIYDLLDDIYSIFKLSAAQKNNLRK